MERDWRDCVAAGKVFDSRYRVRTKTGSYRHYDVRAVPIERDGRIIEWVGASTDVTGQREAEEMRGRLTEQLSAAALRTARLQQATSMLAEALTVEQVVEVITEVGRSAIGAERSGGRDARPRAAPAADGQRRAGCRTPRRAERRYPAGYAERDDGGHPGPPAAADREPGQHAAGSSRARRTSTCSCSTPTSGPGWACRCCRRAAPLGALRFSFTRPRKITEEERVFLEALAGQCALAMERASLFEREHTTAETLQRSLLPDQLPTVPGIILEARYLPVTRNMEIGGDWYDAFRLPDGKLAVATGDVMGKGLTAAAGWAGCATRCARWR